ncbi:hypothetical protein [Furfurilactobacillus entadae]|uniref:hypothetical protein n=1 Tax=Furfurilactobacillus entadae TaxID=2922307 RepID=UPI0035EA5D79
MQNVDLTNIVLALFVLYAVLRRQLEPRLIKLNLTTYVFLILFGAASVADAFNHHQITLTSGTKWFVLVPLSVPGCLAGCEHYHTACGSTMTVWSCAKETG